jgi:NAD(P)-dependent dehydrogenase (short-subunit alcohol dehydrogenase family)
MFTDRIALITGASRGIGAALALELGARGAQLVLVARNVDGLEAVDDAVRKAGGKAATLVPMDLRDGERIDALGPAIYERFGKLDMLVGNAAILGDLSPLTHTTPKVWDQIMRVNVDANWRLIRMMDPLLRLSDAGRAVFVTSSVGAHPRAYWGAYGASKAALDNIVLTYAAENAASNLRINLFDPGATATQMRAGAFPGEDASKLPTPAHVAAQMLPLLAADCTNHGGLIRAA